MYFYDADKEIMKWWLNGTCLRLNAGDVTEGFRPIQRRRPWAYAIITDRYVVCLTDLIRGDKLGVALAIGSSLYYFRKSVADPGGGGTAGAPHPL